MTHRHDDFAHSGDIWQCLETILVIITGGLLQVSSVQSPGTLLNILQWQNQQCINSSGIGKVCYKWSVTRDWSFHSDMLKQGSKKTETFCVVVQFIHIIMASQSRKGTPEFTSELFVLFNYFVLFWLFFWVSWRSNADQAGLDLTEMHLPLPPEWWD